MECANCGAQLRPTAHFCNRCGAPTRSAAIRVEQGVGAKAGQRMPSGGLPSWIAHAEPSGIQGAHPVPSAGVKTAQLGELEAPQAADSPPMPAPPTRPGIRGPDAATPTSDELGIGAALGAAGARWDTGMPWPLPAGIIVDGRYRVETLLAGDEQESIYRVTDLRGYERCWACGVIHGAGAAGERFCRDCGADMLARELIMHERWLGDAETAASTAIGAQEAEAGGPRVFIQGERAYRVEPKVVRPAAFPLGARLVAGAATDLGRTRAGEQNEDSALSLVLDRLHDNQTLPFGIFAVADGLGGHANGQRASRLAVSVLAHTILRQVALPLLGAPADAPVDDDVLADLLREAVQSANRSLCASNQDTGIDAGSTLVAALIHGSVAQIVNVGDSRAYVCDDQGLRRITSDHSLVEQLVAGGMIGPEEVYTHPQRNQIFRSLGDDPGVTVDLFTQELRPGMRLLLCSDGLWEMVRDPRIEELLRSAPDPQAACDALIADANERGGEDNITGVVVEAR